MKRALVALTIIFFCIGLTSAQNLSATAKTGNVTAEYNRNSLTVLFLDGTPHYSNDVRVNAERIVIPDKFDDNLLSQRILRLGSNSKISDALYRDNIANSILAKWFSRDDKGNFSMDLIHNRGLYNATDEHIIQAKNSKLGLDLVKDAGEALIAHSYIMVIKLKDIKTMTQVYNEIDAQRRVWRGDKAVPVMRTHEGFQCNATCYLFRIDSVSDVIDELYNEMWIFEEDTPEERNNKITKFNNYKVPIKLETTITVDVDGSVPKTKGFSHSLLITNLLNKSITASIGEFETSIDNFKVKNAVYSTFPIRAKIGMKEGLSVDDRYFVYEHQLDRNGNQKDVRIGVVRAKRVADNRTIADGKSSMSKFYQVAGRHIKEGMIMNQAKDAGTATALGFTKGDFNSVFFRTDVRVSGSMVKIPMVHTFLDLRLQISGKYNGNVIDLDDHLVTFATGYLGLSKGFATTRNSVASISGAIGYEWATSGAFDDYKIKSIQAIMAMVSAEFAHNITYNTKLFVGVDYIAPISNAYIKYDGDDDGDEKISEYAYTDFFNGRIGKTIKFGIRLEM
ncbi:MAG: hypothetical protein MJ069_04835 [Salinivirgaceae bacterium]|nr:hypothetical protein [Salinivirgaceae bacterium]